MHIAQQIIWRKITQEECDENFNPMYFEKQYYQILFLLDVYFFFPQMI